MKRGTVYFQRWVANNRLLLWWMIFLPLMLLILVISWEHLTIPVEIEEKNGNFFQELFQSFPLIILARVVVIAVGVVIIMICLFLPVFRVGKEGVQWTREKEEELAQVTGEITGAEVEELVEKESLRWSLVYKWLRLTDTKEVEPSILLRELLSTVWEAFPEHRISITIALKDKEYTLRHPLLTRMVSKGMTEEEVFGVKLGFSPDFSLFFYVYPGDPVGFSAIDENFILILCEVFWREALQRQFSPLELVAYFDLVNNPLEG